MTAPPPRPRHSPWFCLLVLLGLAGALVVATVNTFRGTLDGKRFEPELKAQIKPGAARAPRGIEVELSHLNVIPGSSYARVKVLDEGGDELQIYEFSTGYRWNCESARVQAYPARPYLELLVIVCGSDMSREDLERAIGPGPYVRKEFRLRQFFGITRDDRLVPVRIEGETPALLGLGGFGPDEARDRSQADLLGDLRSDDPIAVLGALNALQGSLPAELRRAIEPLAQDTDPWIAEAAAFVIRSG